MGKIKTYSSKLGWRFGFLDSQRDLAVGKGSDLETKRNA
jgi:hypothetical protein